MILTVKIEIDKSQENFLAVLQALEAFDIASTTWEDETKAPEVKVQAKVAKDADLSSSLSAAVDRLRRQHGL